MKQVADFHYAYEAYIAKGVLDAAGIPSEVFEANNLYPGVVGIKEFEVRLMVTDDDYDSAVTILAASSSEE